MYSVNRFQDTNDYQASVLFDQIDKPVKKADNILSVFGFRLHYVHGWWYACRDEEYPGWHRYSTSSLRALIEKVVPPPPILRTPGWTKYWAKACLAACVNYGDVKFDALAQAAFEAYDLVPTVDEFEKFIKECETLMNSNPF